jgi:hypothetical protein
MTRDLHEGVARIKCDRNVIWLGNAMYLGEGRTAIYTFLPSDRTGRVRYADAVTSTHCGLRHVYLRLRVGYVKSELPPHANCQSSSPFFLSNGNSNPMTAEKDAQYSASYHHHH